MDIIIKNRVKYILYFAFAFALGCKPHDKMQDVINSISGEDISLFRGVGLDRRYIPNTLNGRINIDCGDKRDCELILKGGKLIHSNSWPPGNSEKELATYAHSVVSRFFELEFDYVFDIGQRDIMFRKNGEYALYTEDICFNELFQMHPQIVKVTRLKENWYLLDFESINK